MSLAMHDALIFAAGYLIGTLTWFLYSVALTGKEK